MCIRVIILIILPTSTILRIRLLILYISEVAEVAATELLKVQTAHYIPVPVLVVARINKAVCML